MQKLEFRDASDMNTAALETILRYQAKRGTLTKLILARASLDELAIDALCECIQQCPLKYVDLTQTTLSHQQQALLLNIVSTHSSLQFIHGLTIERTENAKENLKRNGQKQISDKAEFYRSNYSPYLDLAIKMSAKNVTKDRPSEYLDLASHSKKRMK